jgi:hypothetical protein
MDLQSFPFFVSRSTQRHGLDVTTNILCFAYYQTWFKLVRLCIVKVSQQSSSVASDLLITASRLCLNFVSCLWPLGFNAKISWNLLNLLCFKFADAKPYVTRSDGDESNRWRSSQSDSGRFKWLYNLNTPNDIIISELISDIYYYWLSIISLAVLYNFIIIPARVSFSELEQGNFFTTWMIIDILADVLYVIDFFASFRIGQVTSWLWLWLLFCLNYLSFGCIPSNYEH